MEEIDWHQIAITHGLNVGQFKRQIFTLVCAVVDVELDGATDGENAFKFTCEQEEYDLELTVTRITKNGN